MRILAPLLVLALLAFVLARWACDPVRAADRAWIEAAWDRAVYQPAAREELLARLDGYLARDGDDPEARWFAARAYLKAGEVDRAIDAVWDDPALGAAPGTSHRFGRLLLRVLGFRDDANLKKPRYGAAMAALALAEAGDEQASVVLDATIRERVEGGLLDVVYGTFLYSSRDGARRVATTLRSRNQPESRVVAAMAAIGPDDYPEREDDLARLGPVAKSERERREQRVVWASVCLALGCSEDARALEVLSVLHRRLSRSTDEEVRSDAAVAAAGLLAGGRWTMLEPLVPYLGAPGPYSHVRLWYAHALATRLARGDPQAPDALMALWRSLREHPDPPLVERLATELLLRDALPPPEFAVDPILSDLESESGTEAMRAVAAAWRLRRGEARGRADLLAVLRRLGESDWVSRDPLIGSPLWISPVLTVARALTLYGDAKAP